MAALPLPSLKRLQGRRRAPEHAQRGR